MNKIKLYPDGFSKIEFFNLSDGTELVTYFGGAELQHFLDEFHTTEQKWSPEAFCDFLNAKYDPTMVIRILPNKRPAGSSGKGG